MASPLLKTMKAWVVTQRGEPKDALVLESNHSAPGPPTGSNIVVKVTYASLNNADVHFMGTIPAWLPFRWRPIPGLDFVGEIIQRGPSAPAHLPIGAEVCGALNVMSVLFGHGSLAEYITIPSDIVVIKPSDLGSSRAVGAFGVAGQTAALMVRGSGGIKAGDRILINGVSGGVGVLLAQVLKAIGATVYGVCSQTNAEMVKGLGVDYVIDYTKHNPLTAYLALEYGDSPFDLIYDCVGSQELFSHSTAYLKEDRLFINIVGGRTEGIVPFLRNRVLPTALGGIPRNYRLLGLSPSATYARDVLRWVEEGKLKEFPIDSEYAMGEVVKAYERVQSRRARGKVVVKIANE
ncbi:Zinc alcohol dehydrogenase [Pleurostoma richardsiae]|uniref:Zinc alcohol dehydrogenase n=1 Tax=Pleurostoma richardsiae TaxID=41990 RepID=A0AA38VHA0_9PEZI|nr:Zinc alcohol dehydrogenase [Pleurostoma richardsiae]